MKHRLTVILTTLALLVSAQALAGGHKSAAPKQALPAKDIVDTAVSAGSWLAQAASSNVQARTLGIRMGASF